MPSFIDLYRDEGCAASPTCLNCPLPQCKYDDPLWYRQQIRNKRDQEVRKVQNSEGLTVPQIASRFALSRRTIFRILSRPSFSTASTL